MHLLERHAQAKNRTAVITVDIHSQIANKKSNKTQYKLQYFVSRSAPVKCNIYV